jgi:hypothetical protein
MPDAAEPFNVLRLVLCTQPRSNTIAFGTMSRCADAKRVHLTSSPGARPSGRFTVRTEVNKMIDLRAGGVEAA